MIIHWNTRTNPQVFLGVDDFHSHVSSATETIEPEVEEVFSGGYEYHPYAFPKKKYELKKKEKKVEKVIVDLVTKTTDKPKKKDLEIGLRLRLAQEDLRYKKKYLDILYKETLLEYQRIREEEEITVILMML